VCVYVCDESESKTRIHDLSYINKAVNLCLYILTSGKYVCE